MADDDAERMARAVAEVRAANNTDRTINTVLGALSGAVTGSPLVAVTQAVIANQQPTTTERILNSQRTVTPAEMGSIRAPSMDEIRNAARPAPTTQPAAPATAPKPTNYTPGTILQPPSTPDVRPQQTRNPSDDFIR